MHFSRLSEFCQLLISIHFIDRNESRTSVINNHTHTANFQTNFLLSKSSCVSFCKSESKKKEGSYCNKNKGRIDLLIIPAAH